MLGLTQWMTIVDPNHLFTVDQIEFSKGYHSRTFVNRPDPTTAQVDAAKSNALYYLANNDIYQNGNPYYGGFERATPFVYTYYYGSGGLNTGIYSPSGLWF